MGSLLLVLRLAQSLNCLIRLIVTNARIPAIPTHARRDGKRIYNVKRNEVYRRGASLEIGAVSTGLSSGSSSSQPFSPSERTEGDDEPAADAFSALRADIGCIERSR